MTPMMAAPGPPNTLIPKWNGWVQPYSRSVSLDTRLKSHTNLVWIRESKKDCYMEPVQDRGWHPRAELRVAIERVTDEVQGTHLLAYHLLVVEELQQVKVCDSHTKLVWEDGQSAPAEAPEIYSKLICGREQLPKRCVLVVPPPSCK